MKCYLDSSALLKPEFAENEAIDYQATFDMLKAMGWTFATSVLSKVEVRRAIRREVASGRITAKAAEAKAGSLFDDVDVAIIDPSVIDAAGEIDGESLRSLDAIHLATALIIGADLVITYDDRMLRACMDAGVMTAQPGVEHPVVPDGWEIIPVTDDIASELLDQYEAAFFGTE